MSTISKTTKQCQCGDEFETTVMEGFPGLTGTHCPPCLARIEQEHEKERAERWERELEAKRAELIARFVGQAVQMTPERLRTPDTTHQAFNADLWRRVLAWKPTREKPWLGIVGATGECKTRCAFLLLRRFAEEDARAWPGHGNQPNKFDAEEITGMDFNRLVVERFSKEQAEGGNFLGRSVNIADLATAQLRSARTADILVFDELGKLKPTAGTVDEIFSLIDYRMKENLITIWTSNSMPESFCARWPEEYAAPGCGRIIEASTIIVPA